MKTTRVISKEIDDKLKALAKIEKKSKNQILKRILLHNNCTCDCCCNHRFDDFTDAELRVLEKIKWL